MEEQLIALYDDARKCTQGFQKKGYHLEITALQEKYADLFDALKEYLDDPAHPVKALCSCVPEHVRGSLVSIRSKRKLEREILDHNMTMVTYFLPLIRNVRSDRSAELAQSMADTWNLTFPGHRIGSPTIEQIEGGFKYGLCYITTAVCKSLGKPDDCRELALLREYRDTYMMRSEAGRSLVKEYYNVAPTIVKRISKSEGAEGIYESIWVQYLNPCIQFIEENRLADCEKIYTNMVYDLEEKYLYQ